MKSDVPRAYIREKYLNGKLPDANPFGVKENGVLFGRNTLEYKHQTGELLQFSRMHRSSPVSARITF